VSGSLFALSSEQLPGMGALLQNLSDKVKLCYERAAEAKERADEMLDPEAKADFLNVERRWLLLARSYQFGERLDDFTRESSRRAKTARAFPMKAPLLDADGQVVGLVGATKDISEHRNRKEEREVLLSELRHRLRNSLSLVQAIARQTINPGDALERFEKRLIAYAQSEEVLLARSGKTVMLRELINAHRLAFNMANRVSVHGADLPLTHNWAIQLGIAIHELATNSMKHGALGGDGHVTIIWTVENSGEEERNLLFIWDEIHSPSQTKPNEPGFGCTVLTQIVPAQLNGIASLELEAGALRWTLQVAL
jgi:two-component sensor histidine kinase